MGTDVLKICGYQSGLLKVTEHFPSGNEMERESKSAVYLHKARVRHITGPPRALIIVTLLNKEPSPRFQQVVTAGKESVFLRHMDDALQEEDMVKRSWWVGQVHHVPHLHVQPCGYPPPLGPSQSIVSLYRTQGDSGDMTAKMFDKI